LIEIKTINTFKSLSTLINTNRFIQSVKSVWYGALNYLKSDKHLSV